MAPKSAAKAKAKTRPRRLRACVGLPRGSQTGLLKHNAERRQAVLDKPGAYYECPNCSAPVRVPHSGKDTSVVRCPMRVPIQGSPTVVCDFKTKVRCWRQRVLIPDARAELQTQSVKASITRCDQKVKAGELTGSLFWNTVRRDAAQPPAAA